MDIEQMPDQQAGRIAGARRILANVEDALTAYEVRKAG